MLNCAVSSEQMPQHFFSVCDIAVIFCIFLLLPMLFSFIFVVLKWRGKNNSLVFFFNFDRTFHMFLSLRSKPLAAHVALLDLSLLVQ